MDQRERRTDLEEAMRAVIGGSLSEVWTAMPAIVQSFDSAKQTCVVQIAIKSLTLSKKGDRSWVALKPITDVPVIFPRCGNFVLTFPLVQGDEVLVVFSSRCKASWQQNGGVQTQYEFRMHDLSDGFAIPGPASGPKLIPNFSTDTMQLRTVNGTLYVEIGANGQINIVAPQTGGQVNIIAAGKVNINSPQGVSITGNLAVKGSVTATGDGSFAGKAFGPHVHGGVQSGSGETGGPIG